MAIVRRLTAPAKNPLLFVVVVGVAIVAGCVLAVGEVIETWLSGRQR